MVLMISGRTDICAFYSEWFWNRYQEEYVDVRNPFYPQLVSRIYWKDVDLLLFCTKNPIPILKYLDKITQPILFHVTLTPYKKEIEPKVEDKKKIIASIHEVAKIIGKDRVYVRYDPIFLSEDYPLSYHKKAFSKLCKLLEGATTHIIVSFLDDYQNVRKNKSILKAWPFREEDYQDLASSFVKIARQHQMTIQTCCEEKNGEEYGFLRQDCLSQDLAFQLTGKKFKKWRARGKMCNCVELVDIGQYNTCQHYCRYCYANYDEKQVQNRSKCHDPHSSLLIGHVTEEDIIKVRKG